MPTSCGNVFALAVGDRGSMFLSNFSMAMSSVRVIFSVKKCGFKSNNKVASSTSFVITVIIFFYSIEDLVMAISESFCKRYFSAEF